MDLGLLEEYELIRRGPGNIPREEILRLVAHYCTQGSAPQAKTRLR